MRNLIFLIALFAFTIVRVAAATPEPNVKVFKSRGSAQCEPKSGTSPEIMRGDLEKAGVTVISIACGNDGKMYPAMCGATDGAINIFVIPQRKAAQAATLQFAKLSSLPDASENPCP
jgi:hypothetical protein